MNGVKGHMFRTLAMQAIHGIVALLGFALAIAFGAVLAAYVGSAVAALVERAGYR